MHGNPRAFLRLIESEKDRPTLTEEIPERERERERERGQFLRRDTRLEKPRDGVSSRSLAQKGRSLAEEKRMRTRKFMKRPLRYIAITGYVRLIASYRSAD